MLFILSNAVKTKGGRIKDEEGVSDGTFYRQTVNIPRERCANLKGKFVTVQMVITRKVQTKMDGKWCTIKKMTGTTNVVTLNWNNVSRWLKNH